MALRYNFNFAIGIPTINQWDLLKDTINRYSINFPCTDLFIVDNGHQDIKIDARDHFIHVIKNCKAKSVAESWNQLSRLIFYKADYALILNDDVFLNRKEHEIRQLIYLHSNADFFRAASGFHSFILPKSTFNKIGCFDINFKGAYFEDNDYWRRMELANCNIICPQLLNPEVIKESASINKDPGLNKHYQANHDYYIKKWGGLRGGEKYDIPFNDLMI